MTATAKTDGERRSNSARIRRAIVKAAHAVFLEEGYEAAIERIAARAGVAARTIFNVFGTKEALFRTVVLTDIISFDALLGALNPQGDIREELVRFAVAYTDQALSPDALAFHRLLFAEQTRFGETISGIWRSHFERLMPPLCAFFEKRITNGAWRPADPALIAEHFMVAIMGHARVREIFDLDPPDQAARRMYIVDVVERFLRGVEV